MSDLDSDAPGDVADVASGGGGKTPKKSRSSRQAESVPSSAKKTVPDVGGELNGDDDTSVGACEASTAVCWLCNEAVVDLNDLFLQGSNCFHKGCHSAKQQFDRILKTEEFQNDKGVQQFAKDKPIQYKYKILELKEAFSTSGSGSKSRRGSAERAEAVSLAREVQQFTKVSEQKPVFLLGKNAYIQWWVREEGMEKDDAVTKWDADVKDNRIFSKIEGGVKKLAVKGHTCLMAEQGMMGSNRYTREQDLLEINRLIKFLFVLL
jgi:hypothetical protein